MDEEKEIKAVRGQKERIISIVVLVLMFITIWYMLNIVLMTFIITFIFYHLVQASQRKLRQLFPVLLPDGLVLTELYIIVIFLFTIASIEFMPKLVLQFTDIANIFMSFDIDAVRKAIDPRMADLLSNVDFNKYISQAGTMLASTLATIGSFGFNLFLSLILSFLILLEKAKIKRFGTKLRYSRISYIYEYLILFGGNFVSTFGKVMKVQVIIALINSIISMIALAFLGFPQIMSLGVMVFTLGLIPVAGMIISLVPLSIIAFNIGGISKVMAVIILIILIHMLEAYVLNPKLMSDKTDLPICFVFIILLVSEHYLGVWGLLIGVPIFIFLMNALEVDYKVASDNHQKKSWRKRKQEDNDYKID